MSLRLIKPKSNLKAEYSEMLEEWKQSGEKYVPFVLEYDITDFDAYVDLLNGFALGKGIPSGWVNHSTYWLVNKENKILGVSNLRHGLSDNLLEEGGHIGYGIRPSERRKGHATKILALTLLNAKKKGIDKALLTCDKFNVASAKVIIKNGGTFWRETELKEKKIHSYWVSLN